ncbi:MAG: hypothetical protein HZB16_00080 [Armatimonadetes bacterium]|nr:hypothetical protein [Armatimonadota bacterium]
MGKRVNVKRATVPKVNFAKLKDGSDTQVLAFAFFVPGLAYLFALMAAFFLSSKGKGTNALVFLIAWPIVSWILITIVAGGHRSRLNKNHRRGKVAGTAFPEVRAQLATLCRVLDIPKVPDTFIIETDKAAAVVRGMGAPYLIISSRMLELLADREQTALFGVLLGHIKAGTVKWRTFMTTALEMNPILKLLCLPWVVVALLGKNYIEYSHFSADRIALLLLEGDFHMLLTSLIKVMALTTDSIPPDRAQQIIAFLGKTGVEARADDVENMFVLNQMFREIPGLKDRWENVTQTPSDPAFEKQLAILHQRQEMLNPPR